METPEHPPTEVTLAEPVPVAPQPLPPRPPFQFTIRTMLILTALVAVLCNGLFACPYWLAGLTVAVILLGFPACLTVTIVCARGYLRAFAVGGLFPAAIGAILHIDNPRWFDPFTTSPPISSFKDRLESAGLLLAVAGAIVAIGLLGVLVRWMIERSQQQ